MVGVELGAVADLVVRLLDRHSELSAALYDTNHVMRCFHPPGDQEKVSGFQAEQGKVAIRVVYPMPIMIFKVLSPCFT